VTTEHYLYYLSCPCLHRSLRCKGPTAGCTWSCRPEPRSRSRSWSGVDFMNPFRPKFMDRNIFWSYFSL
jgi:hypothetical protein